MIDVIYMDKLQTPCESKVFVKIKNSYDIKVSKGGVFLKNAAHEEAEADSHGFQLSEFIIRSGIIEKMPEGFSMNGYDWNLNNEIKVGDHVFWPIVRFFDYPLIQTEEGLYLLIDIHDLIVKEVDGEAIPLNGFYLFTQENKETRFGVYVSKKPSGWYNLIRKGEEIVYDNNSFNYKAPWKIGCRCFLMVPPFKLEADTGFEFKEEYFLAQKRHILAATC